MKTFITLLRKEMILNIRNMNMVIFAIMMPLVILIILCVIYGDKSAFDGADYTFIQQSIGAISAISICAGGLMGLPLVVSEYRERKILKRYQVTPISPIMLLMVEFLIYVIYSLISLISILLVGKLFFDISFNGSIVQFSLSYILTLLSTLSIGLMVGGIAKNTKSASVIASILYFPMLIFSGTTLPFEVMPEMMQKVVCFFPLTQGIQFMKESFLGVSVSSVFIPSLIMIVTIAICSIITVKCFKWT